MKKLLILSLSVLALFSCNKEDNGLENGYGFVKVNLSQDESTITKADAETVFAVEVLNEQGVVVKSYDDHRKLENEPLKLKAGKYTVKASTGENVEAGWEKPFYTGSTHIDVVRGKTNNCNVVCTLANVKVTVTLADDVLQNFREFALTVTNGKDNGSLIFSNINGTLDKAAYFNCTGEISWKLYLINTNGVVFENQLSDLIKDVKPREHYNLKFKIGEDGDKPAVDVAVSIDETTNETIHDVNINLGKKAKPRLTGGSFNITEEQKVLKGTTSVYDVNIAAEAGFKSLKLIHENAVLYALGIPYEVDLLTVDADTKQNLNGNGLEWTAVEENSTTATVSVGTLVSKLAAGNYSMNLTVVDKQAQSSTASLKFNIVEEVAGTTTNVAEPWAKRAFLNGTWNSAEMPQSLGFEYRKETEQSWTKVTDGITTDVSKKSFRVEVKGLEPKTAYVCRALSGDKAANEVSFTTEAAEQLLNMSFDVWTKDGKNYFANSTAKNTDANFIWDSGNKGATMGGSSTTTPTDDVAVSGDGKQAARMESKSVFGNLAAGSIFTGKFVKAVLSPKIGGQLDFGVPYSCRPLQLKGYYNYAPVAIDVAKGDYANLKGTNDACQIYVLLADWDAPFSVNTATETFIDFENDSHIIAMGRLEDNTNTGGYKQFTIDLEYRNNRTPKYVVVVAAASKYGDYFTGGVGSVLMVDEFEFVF